MTVSSVVTNRKATASESPSSSRTRSVRLLKYLLSIGTTMLITPVLFYESVRYLAKR